MIHLICPNPAIDRTLLFHNFAKSTPNRPYDLKEFAGGKSFNVAYAMNFETPSVDFVVHTILGGRNGDYLKTLAADNLVPLIALEIPENTRVCNILVDADNQEVYPVYENSFLLHQTLLDTFTSSLEAHIKDGDTVVFSGSLMTGMPDDYIYRFQEKFQNRCIKFFVDTSGSALKEAYKGKPHVIKINDEEVLDLFPDSKLTQLTDYVHLLQSDLVADIPYFIITLGAKGVLAKMKDTIYFLSVDKVQTKNPIASGDFFLGGLVKFLTLDEEPLTVFKKAISYSTANVLNWYPELKTEQIQHFYNTIKVEKFDIPERGL